MPSTPESPAPSPLQHLPRLVRPAAPIGGLAALWGLSTAPYAAILMEESWRHPVSALAGWMVLWMIGVVPLAFLATVLAARIERAGTGVRHPQRAAWLGVAVGATLATHWALYLFWTPAYALFALTESYRREDNLIGAVLGLLPWAFAIAGLAMARFTARRLRARTWPEPSPEPLRRLPRVPTPWIGGLAYGLAVFPATCGLAVWAADEREAVAAIAIGLVVALFTAVPAGLYGGWAYGRLLHAREPHRAGPRTLELLGVAWIANWVPLMGLSLLPVWRDDHDEQLLAAVVVAALITLGTAAWSHGRAARLAAVG